MTRRGFLPGDQVVVRSHQEILSTLDANGTLDGLPFMAEMIGLCGQAFRVQRRVEKTCVDVVPPMYPNRRFRDNDVVMLDGPRCDGSGHDGCKRGCRIFWKEAWLRSTDEPATPAGEAEADVAAARALNAVMKAKADDTHYFCQSTELQRATEAFPGRKKPWMVRTALAEIRNGDRSLPEIAGLVFRWAWQRLRRAAAGKNWLRGPHTKTPSQSLNLMPGEAVRIRSREQIVETLDRKGRNRGMGICYEMTRCCGAEGEVRYRVDRLIDERTATMRNLTDTVVIHRLRNNGTNCDECLCFDEPGDCPRGELMYWREIWLERP